MKYRAEIDGLRAVAVMPVLLFHGNVPGFSGGYVGVDVFFVISGYLITSILSKDLEQGRYSLLDFYERRARRILPAVYFLLLWCIPVAWIIMLPEQFREFANSVAAVSTFTSNFFFWLQSGYFDQANEVRPLLHTWSLAVEEQFYLFYPLLLYALWRFGQRYIILLIGLLAFASFTSSEWLSRTYPDANFYLLTSRAWELLAGSLCAFLTDRTSLFPSVIKQVAPAAGLVAICVSVSFYDKTFPIPSLYALLPIAGAVSVILFADSSTWAGRLLALKPFTVIGITSYSAYLIHQPLFAFARILLLTEPPLIIMLALILATLILAYLSWRFVEQPFRATSGLIVRRSIVFALSSFFGFALFASGLFSDNTRLFVAMRGEAALEFASFLNYTKSPDAAQQFGNPKCFLTSRNDSFNYYDKSLCLRNEDGKKRYLVLGDSHAAHLWSAIIEAFPEEQFLQANASGCPPLLKTTGDKRCTDLMNFIFKSYVPESSIDGVILAARWSDSSVKELSRTIRYLKQYTSTVIIIGPTIEYRAPLPAILSRADLSDRTRMERFAYSYLDTSRMSLSKKLQKSAHDAKARYVSMVSAQCDEELCRVLSDTGVPMTFDYGHLTLSGARTVVKTLVEKGYFKLR